MGQAKINNHTALAHEILFSMDEKACPIVTPVIKATFDIQEDSQLKFAQKQLPVNLDGEYWGDPENSSYVYEPESAFIKSSTDVVIIGNGICSKGRVTHLLVEINVGPLRKQLGVVGDRQWVKQFAGFSISSPAPFESMPLTYENAFGGWDRRHPDPAKHGFEPRNTVGKGYYHPQVEPTEPMWLPNIENPNQLIRDIADRPNPVGCGFTLPHWQPRARLAGTYDSDWERNYSPMLPPDFDRRFFNAASEGLVSPHFLTGSEPVSITNMTPSGRLMFNLPGIRPPVCQLQLKDHQFVETRTNLDTVIINTLTMQLQLIWRNCQALSTGPHDVEAIDIHYG